MRIMATFSILTLLMACSSSKKESSSCGIPSLASESFQLPFINHEFKSDHLHKEEANGVKWTGVTKRSFSPDSLQFILRTLKIEPLVSNIIEIDFYFNNANADAIGELYEQDGIGVRSYKGGFYIHEFYKYQGKSGFIKWDEQTFTSRSIGMGINQINAQRMIKDGTENILLIMFVRKDAWDHPVWPLGGNKDEVYKKLTAAYLD